MDLRYRLHEWAANRFKGVQYPKMRRIRRKPDWKPYGSSVIIEIDQNTSKARFSCIGRFVLFIYAMIIGSIGLVAIAFGCIVIASLL